MIARQREQEKLTSLLKRHRVVGIIGARQVGKTTLARSILKLTPGPANYFDLENPEDLARLADPMLALKGLKGTVVIDEVQRLPELFPILRVLVDRPRVSVRFLVLGSASPELLRQGSESLAGRIVYHELKGFSLDEVGIENYRRLWLRGGFPRSYLSSSTRGSDEWRRGFIRTFLERDIPQLGINIRSTTLQRFWSMLAHYHGQTWNASEFGRSFGVADTTVRNYLDLLSSALVVRQLQPWHENISKRQVKAPKIYIADSGLLHTLLGIITRDDLERHPKIGSSWEGFVIEQLISWQGFAREECFFWATHAGAELDLLVVRGRKRLGYEVKLTSSPRVTPSMRHALDDLKLQRLYVVHAGEETFQLEKNIFALAFPRLLTDLKHS
ncbi:MAG: ATP-binding protein [Thermoleophilia bacterium]